MLVLVIAGAIMVILWPWFILAAFRRMAKAQEEMAHALHNAPGSNTLAESMSLLAVHTARLADAEHAKEKALARIAGAHEAMAPEAQPPAAATAPPPTPAQVAPQAPPKQPAPAVPAMPPLAPAERWQPAKAEPARRADQVVQRRWNVALAIAGTLAAGVIVWSLLRLQ